MLGDCLKLMEQLPDNSVDLTLTDIPYDAANRSDNGLRNLNKADADILTFDLQKFCESIYRVTSNTIIVFCGKEQFSKIYEFFACKKGTVRPIVWQKSNPSPMNGQHIYLSGVELAVWFKKPGAQTFNAYCKNTVFKYPCGRSKLHPTQKNYDLIEELLLDNSNEGQTVLDPCMGSGTTGVACANNRRNFIGMEISKDYFEISKARIEPQKQG